MPADASVSRAVCDVVPRGNSESSAGMGSSVSTQPPVPESHRAPGARSRIVTGFGSERVDDVTADEARRIADGVRRGVQRRETGSRGRMTDYSGADLDRSAGGAWHVGRR